MRILVQGDSHGNKADIIPKIYKAGEFKIQHLLVVGDFGLWTHFADGHDFLDEVQEAARINNLTVYAIGGNHENWDHWNWFVENMPSHKGFGMVRRRVLLAPKVHTWKWAGKKFIGAGGAVSIDKEYRVAREQGNTRILEQYGDYSKRAYGAKTMYWPNEELTDADVVETQKLGTADYLFTHDCSNFTHWHKRLKNDPASERHRQRIDKVIASSQPRFHFHGHMHEKYDWVNVQSHGYQPFTMDDWDGPETRTIGLEAFKDSNSWGILDTEQDRWYWPSEYYRALDERAERVAERTGQDFVVTKRAVD